MNMTKIFHGDEDFKEIAISAIEQMADEFDDTRSSALDHLHAIKPELKICISMTQAARIMSGSLTGKPLDIIIEKLLEVERNLSRLEGELSE